MRLNRVFLTLFCAGSLAGAGSLAADRPGALTEGPAAERKLDNETVERLLRVQDEQEVAVRLVLLPASVEDRRGRPVTGLTAGDFSLTDENVPQEIKYFSVESDEPVSIGGAVGRDMVLAAQGTRTRLLMAQQGTRLYQLMARAADDAALEAAKPFFASFRPRS